LWNMEQPFKSSLPSALGNSRPMILWKEKTSLSVVSWGEGIKRRNLGEAQTGLVVEGFVFISTGEHHAYHCIERGMSHE